MAQVHIPALPLTLLDLNVQLSEDTYRPVLPVPWDCGAEQSMVSPDCFHNFPFSFGSLMRLIFIYLKLKKKSFSLFLAGIVAARRPLAAASRGCSLVGEHGC